MCAPQGQASVQYIHDLSPDQLQQHGFVVHVLHMNETNPTIRLDTLHPSKQYSNDLALPARVSPLLEHDWVVEGPRGQYPMGSKVLTGTDRSYVVSPLGNLVDEKYTAYFDFQSPKRA